MIGVVKDDKNDIYQDFITAPLNREHDDNASGDAEGLEENMVAAETFRKVLTSIPKFCFWTLFIVSKLISTCMFQLKNIIQAVRSSPQR